MFDNNAATGDGILRYTEMHHASISGLGLRSVAK
jgi:hypothetical protein